MTNLNDTIVALSTPNGVGAIAVIRLSGNEAISIANELFEGKDLTKAPTHTLHFGSIRNGEEVLDEVVASVFKGPRSYTKEDVIEFSCHASPYIIEQLLQLTILKGARMARPGEFTQRAFVHGRFDLAQAEAVADLIAAENKAAHGNAIRQMRGGFSSEIREFREKLIHFASMIELELDFSEEDVEFASRKDLKALVNQLMVPIQGLIRSFELGNALKNGIPIVIAGKPNAGKSTLLNALLNEERAIVSNIAGTTRDVIEDVMNIDGISFRFIDTAGLRDTEDEIEAIGVSRTKEQMQKASVILYLIDLERAELKVSKEEIATLKSEGIPYLLIGNKADVALPEIKEQILTEKGILISAKDKTDLEELKRQLMQVVDLEGLNAEATFVTNSRHVSVLKSTHEALERVIGGIDNQITNDFLAMDIRQALHHLGEITGEITTDDLLDNIFSKFCIGK